MDKEMKINLNKDVINGFSYSFTRRLLDRFKELLKEDKIFDNNSNYNVLPVAGMVFDHLNAQLGGHLISLASNQCQDKYIADIEGSIKAAEEFLSIFEKNSKEKNIASNEVSLFFFNFRTLSALKRLNVNTLEEISEKVSVEDLISLSNVGDVTVKEIRRVLSQHGLRLKFDAEV